MHTPSLILKSDIVVKPTTLKQYDHERVSRQIAERDDPTIALIGRVLDRFTEEYAPGQQSRATPPWRCSSCSRLAARRGAAGLACRCSRAGWSHRCLALLRAEALTRLGAQSGTLIGLPSGPDRP
jgi:hypothetical protein